MDAKVFLSDFTEKFEIFSKRVFSEKIKEASKIDPVAATSLKNIQNYMSGGKKVRPALTWLGFGLAGGTDIRKLLPAAFAVELMHNSLLIHDDYVDNDETRRGKPTMHRVYLGKNGEHYAASMAIITSDVGIFWANEILSTLSFPPALITKASNYFNHFLLNTGYGELMDIDYDFRKETNWRNILNIRVYKTAYYTFIMPLAVGAALGNGSSNLFRNVEKFGYNIGLAFQLRDDVLGLFGDSDKTGKSTESDILEGKKSLLYFKAIELGNAVDRGFLRKHYGNIKNRSEINKIKTIIKDTGALSYSEKLAEGYIEKGKKYISQIAKNSDIKETLSTFADYMIERNK